ncbi:AsmA-like C-terminal region-containing protein, partial [Candidatus Pelagibacter sp.]|nr:AsmA-like C-terminal region-containing protein [Candidatus Pelagibacter sp.]
ESNEESLSIFDNLNSKIKINIKKTYIDEVNYMNNLYGNIDYDRNKINNLKLESSFPNKKKINLSIEIKKNSETITKLFSSYPKPLIRRYDFIKGFEEGYLDFYSSKKEGVSNSVLIIDNFKVKEVPIFAKLLSLASLQGIADLLTGEGIRFTDFEMNFSNQKGLTTIEEMYAIGPAVSILMNGYIETKKLVSLRGTLVPATTINRSIASIPLLGKILIGDKVGEGVFGVSFKIKGPPKNLKTSVNPIKTLTPRFITRTLEKLKRN